MNKIRLDFNDLTVESFQTTPERSAQKLGTVHAYGCCPICCCDPCCCSPCDTCCDTCANTCANTCGSTCGITCDFSCDCETLPVQCGPYTPTCPV